MHLLLILVFVMSVQGYETQLSASGMVRYEVGHVDSDVVITAGHSGYKKPAVYGERYENGCYISANDTCAYNSINCTDTTSKDKCGTRVIADVNTSSLAKLLAHRIKLRMNGVRPHVIICDLHRSRVDVNREVNEATFGMSNAKIVYDEYHDFIHRAIVNSSNSGSRNVFYIDIHGQAGNTKTVIGNLIDNNSPSGLAQPTLPNSQAPQTSLGHLVNVSGKSLEDLVRGTYSIGGLIENNSTFGVVPSPTNQMSSTGKWYRGGYSLRE
ncbi:hypothetical protein EB796_011109 [Bugula neritina]|uniref:Uncharacterized protein n=1 Tax=Bugula neritina TaxID=10212 RepID=A0A7J7JW13_BUGNE|nr:hypothetical protein EB796_011109 [Bugula neritina]